MPAAVLAALDALDDQVKALPPEAQLELAHRILRRAEAEEERLEGEEILRRLREIDEGTAEWHTAGEVLGELRARFG